MIKKGEKVNYDTDFYADTMEHEEKRKTREALNCERGIFENKYADGLNRQKSIFDKNAIFVTAQEGEKEYGNERHKDSFGRG